LRNGWRCRLVPVADRGVDDGNRERSRVIGSEYERVESGPRLTVEVG